MVNYSKCQILDVKHYILGRSKDRGTANCLLYGFRHKKLTVVRHLAAVAFIVRRVLLCKQTKQPGVPKRLHGTQTVTWHCPPLASSYGRRPSAG
jgi:hypothetical protein